MNVSSFGRQQDDTYGEKIAKNVTQPILSKFILHITVGESTYDKNFGYFCNLQNTVLRHLGNLFTLSDFV
jgi:hypothetical protein